MLIVAMAFNVAVCALVAASYCRSRQRQGLADDLEDFCADPSSPETCRPLAKRMQEEKDPGRIPAS
ncbi:MAG TPA: hypothetical protein VLH81_04030 [Desulfobacterales bacterium]|nr:hypothetical protein [Desulfobacterales bacterium]